jgi:hypothetical protein
MKGLLEALHDGTGTTTKKPLKSRSCNRVRDVLRNMLNDAMRDGPLEAVRCRRSRPGTPSSGT